MKTNETDTTNGAMNAYTGSHNMLIESLNLSRLKIALSSCNGDVGLFLKTIIILLVYE